MITDLDIYRAANMLIERYGRRAVAEAAKMIDAMLDHGDLESRTAWLRIKQAVADLQARPTGPLH
jgi:hypothetical protein